MERVTPRQFITKVARAFPDSPEITDFGDDVFGLRWEHEGIEAGAWSGPDGGGIFLAEASLEVRSVADAINLLRQIFADEAVAKAHFTGPNMEYCVLGPADDKLDCQWVRSWSGEKDSGGPPEWPDEDEPPKEGETPGFWSLFLQANKF